ncbi:hypothetical protein [Paenibacillus sp. L3-i20]|uniref:hypothetical protein n=1 Tax=Paenibacillus sp. L3-i20 TaxID=2905833 RepID=UPI001EE0BA9B|nr:hypothetical protein [Paenibacillus sp. L3-i20]GKU77580.1 hypothetical protein L3i20_v219770 [Paenibacillus sp. L3-i20]
MGGKNHLLDPTLLSELYHESRLFNEQADTRIKAIHKELSNLNDLLIHTGSLDYESGTLTREIVLELIDEATVLKEELESTQSFVEARLADAVLMEKAIQSKQSSTGIQLEGFRTAIYLKK